MYSKILFYLEIDGNKDLYAVIEGSPDTTTIYSYGKWELCGKNLYELLKTHNLKQLNSYDAAIYTLGSSPKDLYSNMGYRFYEREREVITDSFKHFFDDFIEFAIDDYYHAHHNKEKDLRYRAKELDEHYGTDYYETIFGYYDEYLMRKEEFANISINKISDDIIIEFSKDILKK